MAAGWYGSQSLVRQVLECENMRRAIRAHESTVIAINTLLIHALLEFRDEFCGNIVDIFELLQILRLSLESNDTDQFKNTWVSLNTKFEELHLDAKVEKLIAKKQANCILQIFMVAILTCYIY